MISDKSFDISFNPSRLFVSDIPIKSKAYCRVFLDVIGEGGWNIVEDNLYDVINDTIVFASNPIGKFLAIQIATTPSEFTQTPTENTMVLSIKNEIKTVADNVDNILEINEFTGNISIVANSIDDVNTVSTNILNVNTVGTNIDDVNTVATNILNVNTVGTNIDDVNTVATNVLNVNTVGTNIDDVNTVATNVLNVNTVGTNIDDVNLVADNILNVNTVGTNIDDVNLVADNIIDVQNAEENATLALNSKNLAEKWASEDRNVEVTAGEYSAKHWAEVAEETVTIGVIDDVTSSNTKTYSSNKIESLDSAINTKIDMHIPLSGVTAYHLLEGDLSVSNEVITNGFGTYLYTGNTTTLPTINLGMDITSQHGNDATEKYGYLIIIKSRSAIGVWSYVDSVRGITKYIDSSSTAVEGTDANMFTLNTVAGVTTVNIGTSTRTNTNGVTYVMEVYQTTHIKTGTTNHGKAYTEHYNMVTGFTIDGYAGSGLAGHDLLHSLGRKLGLAIVKNLGAVSDFIVDIELGGLALNSTAGILEANAQFTKPFLNDRMTTKSSYNNISGSNYVMYGWANSYIDESGKLIGNFEIGTYQGTGVARNKVTTRAKVAMFMPKRLDSTGNWNIYDNQRIPDGRLIANLSNAESVYDAIDFVVDGFVVKSVGDTEHNASGGQYLYFGVYDNDSGSGKSKYPRATDTSNLNINNAIIPYAQGIDGNGTKVSTAVKNETLVFENSPTAGKNYPYSKLDGTNWYTPYRPRYLRSDLVAERSGDNPDYFDVNTNTWYNTLANPDLVNNGTFDVNTTGWTDNGLANISWVSGVLRLTNNSTGYGQARQSIATVIGKKYIVVGRGMPSTSTVAVIQVGTTVGGVDLGSGSSSVRFEFVAQTTTTYITLQANNNGAGTYCDFDNISVYTTNLEIGSEIPSRTYLDIIAYADASGQLTYIEALPKTQYFDRIETGSNRKVMYLADYGISAIQVNKRYVLDNPFGNDRFMDCDVKLELFLNNRWGIVGQSVGNTSSTDIGCICGVMDEGIVIQTAQDNLAGLPYSDALNTMGLSTYYTSAPARVTIQFNGKTGRTR